MIAWRADRRLTAARADLAALHLQGEIVAPRYVAGEARTVIAEVADLRRQPRLDAPLETQALFGERVVVFDEDEGWGWVQLAADGYVGYIALHALEAGATAATHRVAANRTFIYPAADMKRPVLAALPLGACVAVDGQEAASAFSRLAGGGFVFSSHLVPLEHRATDFVAVAERLMHTPYLWGGKSPLGLDCSGLVQLTTAQCGIVVPRDADLQEQAFGEPVATSEALEGLRRGDLVFWPGHVGIMRDPDILLHANAHHMSVVEEPLRQAAGRILVNGGLAVSGIRRLAARA